MATATDGVPADAQRYAKYWLCERIGRGGMAEVFRALERRPDGDLREVVVKRILPTLAHEPKFVRMFLDEAAISARLDHPNIVRVFESGSAEGSCFMAMERVHGQTLAALMAEAAEHGASIPPLVAADVARQVARGLAYAHALTAADGQPLGLVHRDVTPGNILIGDDGVAKVFDFGIARVAQAARGSSQTKVGAVKGKLAYLSPEQINGLPIDARVDVFALGIVLWEALTGRRLFKDDNELRALKLVLEMPVPAPSSLRGQVPPALDAVTLRALERDRERRFAGAAEMGAALAAVLAEERCPTGVVVDFMRDVAAGWGAPHAEFDEAAAPATIPTIPTIPTMATAPPPITPPPDDFSGEVPTLTMAPSGELPAALPDDDATAGRGGSVKRRP